MEKDLLILEQRSEQLFTQLVLLLENKTPELAELLVQLALQLHAKKKNYLHLHQLNFEDYVETTDLVIAMLEAISNQQRH